MIAAAATMIDAAATMIDAAQGIVAAQGMPLLHERERAAKNAEGHSPIVSSR